VTSVQVVVFKSALVVVVDKVVATLKLVFLASLSEKV
jgi:hypothetical protein